MSRAGLAGVGRGAESSSARLRKAGREKAEPRLGFSSNTAGLMMGSGGTDFLPGTGHRGGHRALTDIGNCPESRMAQHRQKHRKE